MPRSLSAARQPVARRGRVVVHPQHPLALEQDRLRAADALEHDEARALARQRARMARDEAAHALHRRLLAAGREEQHAHALGRLLAQHPRQLEQHGDGGEVVVGAGHDGARRDVSDREHRAERDQAADAAHAAQPEQRAEPGERRSGDDQPHQRRRRLLARVPVREPVGDPAGRARMEDHPAARRVVMGDEHDRLGAGRVARLGDDVVRRAAREQPPEQVRAAGDVVGDARGRRQPARCGERSGAAREARRRPRGAHQRHGDRERAGRPLPLDARVQAEPGEPPADPLGGAALPLGGGRPLDRLQVLDDRAQAARVRRHGRGG